MPGKIHGRSVSCGPNNNSWQWRELRGYQACLLEYAHGSVDLLGYNLLILWSINRQAHEYGHIILDMIWPVKIISRCSNPDKEPSLHHYTSLQCVLNDRLVDDFNSIRINPRIDLLAVTGTSLKSAVRTTYGRKPEPALLIRCHNKDLLPSIE